MSYHSCMCGSFHKCCGLSYLDGVYQPTYAQIKQLNKYRLDNLNMSIFRYIISKLAIRWFYPRLLDLVIRSKDSVFAKKITNQMS